jgi:coiled-coil domain-containing protein 55
LRRVFAQVQQIYEDALAQDPSVFDYDGVYDSMQEQKLVPKQQDKLKRESKYIASLLETAQQRKREQVRSLAQPTTI